MGLMIMAILCVSLSILLIPSVSSHGLEQSSPQPQASEAVRFPRLVPARKFRLMEEARVKAHGFPVAKENDDNHQKETISGQPCHCGKRTEQKGMKLSRARARGKGSDMSSRFFTMDYAHIRRRRPVHNMSLQRP